ncbi:hypothetical protein [Pedobacter sp. JY14-1]|uniref:hypothetical protein n=1 Tax=Pedobacter sp. JY14-1 TaxID=3034151 RepID=UPI0023E1D17F|nr:hypothetical protein [Pedobacter sp. JY14-1]
MYAKKKVHQAGNKAEQTAKILANVSALEAKHLLKITGNEVRVYPQLWKDRLSAENWMQCLLVYFVVKKKAAPGIGIRFVHYENGEPLGHVKNGRAVVVWKFEGETG